MNNINNQEKKKELLASVKEEAKAKEILKGVVSHAGHSIEEPSVYFFQAESNSVSSYECCRMC